jgi:hypothetical protein
MLITKLFNGFVFKILVYNQDDLVKREFYNFIQELRSLLNIFFTFSGVLFAKEAAQYL